MVPMGQPLAPQGFEKDGAVVPKGYDVNPKRDKDGLTAHQKKAADTILELGKEAGAKEVWPDQVRPDKSADKLLGLPAVSSYMSRVLDEKGATREVCAENIVEKIKGDSPKASLAATEMALEIHGELNKSKGMVLPVPVTKDQYQELCRTFWDNAPKH